jgi:hypothetical protein
MADTTLSAPISPAIPGTLVLVLVAPLMVIVRMTGAQPKKTLRRWASIR